jgi:hypothetical protein
LRSNVVASAPALNAAQLGGHGSGIPRQATQSETVNQFFGNTPVGMIDCLDAVNLVLAEGLIRTLASGEFDRLGYNFNQLPTKYLATLRPRGSNNPQEMLAGDVGYFKNWPVPEGYSEQGQNVVKLGPDSYWGFGFPSRPRLSLTLNYSGWIGQLISEWQHVYPGRPLPGAQPPGYQRQYTRFLDTAGIGMNVFDLRKGR